MPETMQNQSTLLHDLQNDFGLMQSQLHLRSRLWKRVFIYSRIIAILLIWSNLLFGVAALSVWRDTGFVEIYLKILLFWSSMIGMSLTVFEFCIGPEQRWLHFRNAEQRLGNLAMLYRGQIHPLHNSDRLDVLRNCLQEIRTPLDRKIGWKTLIAQTIEEYFLPPVIIESQSTLLTEGLGPLFGENSETYLKGRLREQRQWFLAKAHRNRFRYFAFLGGIFFVNAINSLWSHLNGQQPLLPVVSSLIILGLYELRDFFDPSTLWRRYRKAAQKLDETDKAFCGRQHPFHIANESIRTQRLVESVEQCLLDEFHFWMMTRQQKADDTDSQIRLRLDYIPKPLQNAEFQIPESLNNLQELLAKNIHEHWSKTRLDEGWRYGPVRSDARREHPCLVEYENLPESEKEYDRITALETLRTILGLGYKIEEGTEKNQ